ncbi:MAG: hypothetical protein HY220_03955 [Candidatus Sungbacteria bacterium]|uniref:Uncharacterized protein n=1 Tax=Candidatus Sungiibacteriota bacterium TaxID=2750080 RepID=A0A9D6QU69_9BACT|nr:hypothetical protein [Candidatus Sungbacteria bacterium]
MKSVEWSPEEQAAREINPRIEPLEDSPGYAEDFSLALEQMTAEFMMEHFEGVKEIRQAERNDDLGKPYHQHGFDFAVRWGNGAWMAIDVSDTHSPEEEFSKLKRMRDLDASIDFTGKRPLVDVHDKEGKVIQKQIPHVTLLYAPKAEAEWKKAEKAWLENGKKGKIGDWVEDQLAVKINILAGLYRSLVYEVEKFPQYKENFKKARDVIDEQIKKIAEESAGRPDSRREMYDLVRHRVIAEGSKKHVPFGK